MNLIAPIIQTIKTMRLMLLPAGFAPSAADAMRLGFLLVLVGQMFIYLLRIAQTLLLLSLSKKNVRGSRVPLRRDLRNPVSWVRLGTMGEDKEMIKLEEHNRNRRKFYDGFLNSDPRPNGIACPECGSELMDSDPHILLTSIPPRKSVHCPNCGYTGSRIS